MLTVWLVVIRQKIDVFAKVVKKKKNHPNQKKNKDPTNDISWNVVDKDKTNTSSPINVFQVDRTLNQAKSKQ